MKLPPCIIRVKIKSEDTRFGLWLPIFIIFPVVLVLFIALAPLALLAALIVMPFGYARTVLCAPALYSVFCAAKGLEVDIQSGKKDETVLVSIK